jgi:hypothetical protein
LPGVAQHLDTKEGGRHDDSNRRSGSVRTRLGNVGSPPVHDLGALMRDTVQIHVTADLPIRVRALTYANRAEIRFGKAFPVVLLVDSDAIAVLGRELTEVQAVLNAAANRDKDGDELPESLTDKDNQGN